MLIIYSTVVKIPVPEASVDPVVNDPLSPALYVARGWKDLPDIYRFHWRGIADRSNQPNPSLNGWFRLLKLLTFRKL